jgi:hypothetical protein
MFKIKKKSDWTWVTSASVSAGVKFVTAGKGSFTLKDPSGSSTKFNRTRGGHHPVVLNVARRVERDPSVWRYAV